jgi:hypothetical protein
VHRLIHFVLEKNVKLSFIFSLNKYYYDGDRREGIANQWMHKCSVKHIRCDESSERVHLQE